MRNVLSILAPAAILLTARAAIAQPPPPPPPLEPEAGATPEATPAPAAEAAPAPATDAAPPKRLTVGKDGVFQPGLLLQGWFVVEHAGETRSTFRLRRAEISVKGQIVPKTVGYAVMIDPAKIREVEPVIVAGPMGDVTIQQPPSAIAALQDFYITYLTAYADISLGQFKIPVSWEGYNSSSKLLLPERALVSDELGDARDVGVRITKTFARWGYSAGIFNGEGLNRRDSNNQKDVALRLEAYPIEGLTLAAVTYDAIGERDLPGTKDRWEADVRYERGPVLVQAELLRARDVVDGGGAVHAQGFYVAAGYKLRVAGLAGELQPVARLGYLDTNLDAEGDQVVHYDVGLNYYVREHAMKLQTAYARQQGEDDATDQLILSAQVAY